MQLKIVKSNQVTLPVMENNVENKQELLYNNSALGEVKNIPIENVLPLMTNGRLKQVESKKKEKDLKEANFERSNRNRAQINSFDEGSRIIRKNSSNNSNQFEKRTTGTKNVRIYNRTQEYNNRSSSTSTFRKGIEGNSKVENSNKSSLFAEEKDVTAVNEVLDTMPMEEQ